MLRMLDEELVLNYWLVCFIALLVFRAAFTRRKGCNYNISYYVARSLNYHASNYLRRSSLERAVHVAALDFIKVICLL
jgi:hypothetical protein